MKEILEIKQAVDRLDNETARSYLRYALLHIQRLKEQPASPHDPIGQLIELYDDLTSQLDKRSFWDPTPGSTHVHVVIGESFAGSMKHALQELGIADTHKLIVLGDNYAVGPLARLDSPEGRKARWEWFRLRFTDCVEVSYEDVEEDYTHTLNRLKQIPEHAEVIVWTSRSVREQTGMRHAIHLLRHMPNPIRLCDACAAIEELSDRPDVQFEYRHSGEITPGKLQHALMRINTGRLLSAQDIAQLAEEWQSLSEQGGELRIWQNAAIVEVPVDYYDAYLLDMLDELDPPTGTNDFIKSARLVGQALGYCEQDIGDGYFEYRVRELVYSGMLEISGVPAGMRYYSIRRR